MKHHAEAKKQGLQNRIFIFLMLLGLMLGTGLWQDNAAVVFGAQEQTQAEEVGLNKKKITISKGETYTLSITGAYEEVSWKVNRKSIATVTKKGVVKGVKAGTTTVIATIDGVKYKCTVVVENPKLSKTKLTGVTGESQKLSVSGTKRTVTYSSKNKSIATVTKNGTVKFKKAGTTTIYAKIGNKKLSCKVTVTDDHFFNLIGTQEERTALQEQLAEKANQVYNEVITAGMTDFEKLRAVHDYIVLNTAYDYENYLNDTISEASYSGEGVLLHGTAVCQGYAETMKLFMDAAGIENELVVGEGLSGSDWIPHAWNLVKLDGSWYHVDATWDDPLLNGADIPGYVGYDYFCVADSKMDDDHTWKKADYPKAEGGEYSTYIAKEQLAEYEEQNQVLASVKDYEAAVLERVAAGERDITLLYPENEMPDTQAALQTIANKYMVPVKATIYELQQVGDYYQLRIIIKME